MKRSTRRLLALLPAVLLLLGLAACSDDDSRSTTTDASEPAAEASAELEVTDVWARTSADGQANGAAYMVLTGGAEDDALLGASVSPDVAGTVELHETVPVDEADDSAGDMGESTDDSMGETGDMGESSDDSMGGMAEGMTMQPVAMIEVPAGDEVVLEPGGLHVMLLELAAPLEEGDTFDLTLTFEQAGEVTVPVEVRDR